MSEPDLLRLRIRERTGPASSAWGTLGIMLVAAAAGAGATLLIQRLTAAPPVAVRTAIVRPPGAVSGAALVAGGWIEAARPGQPVVVSALVPERITDIHVKEGDLIAAGAEIATLRREDLQQQVTGEEAALAHARASLRYAEANAARVTALAGLASPDQQQRSAAEVDMARASVAQAEARLARAQLHLQHTAIVAPDHPRSWRVLRVHHRPGDHLAEEGQRAIAELYDPTQVQARVDVPQRSVKNVRVGGAVQVRTDAAPERTYAGTVLRIEPLADAAKNTISVRIALSDPDDLLFPEMTCTVSFLADETAAAAHPLLPAAALRQDEAGSYALVADRGQLHAARLSIAGPVGPWLAVAEGLASGARVVIDDDPALVPGMRIEVLR